jgi:hypothetical protein
MRKAVILAALTFMLAACGNPKPPVGKWEGIYDAPDTMIAARVEIDDDGKVKVSAPDLTGIETTNPEARGLMRLRLAQELASGWDEVAPRDFDFDGSKFRKPGGVAPQMEWDKDAAHMTLVVYLGRDPARRIALRPVSDFTADPFSSY